MDSIKNISTEKLVNTYNMVPTLPFDIEGTLIAKDGKNIKVESEVGGKVVNYTLRLKEEIEEEVGEKVKIEKENVQSYKIEEKKQIEESQLRKIEDLLKKIGIESTKENIKVAETLLQNNIPVTKENIESLLMTEKYLSEVIEKIDYDSAIKLLKDGIDLEEASLQTIYESLGEISIEEDFSLAKLLGLKRDLTYEEAEKISIKVYGRRMGKDIYDSIIALHRENMEINKENIELVKEVVHKLHDLKKVEDTTFIKVLKDELIPNIENIYRLKHSYDTNVSDKNLALAYYDENMFEIQTTKEDIVNLLEQYNLESSEENIALIEKFILNGLDITEDNINKVFKMKESLMELVDLLDEDNTAKLVNNDIDPLKEHVEKLVDILKEDNLPEHIEKAEERANEILEKLNSVGKVKDEDLISLIKDLSTINNSGQLSSQTVDKVMRLSNVIHTLGDLNENTITLASKRYNYISLNSLYESEMALRENPVVVEPIDSVAESLIRQEYMKAKQSLSVNIVKESITDGVEVEYMPLGELNEYIDKKINRYREVEDTLKSIKAMEGKESELIPIAMKNGMDISMKELTRINYFNENKNGLGYSINNIVKESENMEKNEARQAVAQIEENAKAVSKSLKQGDISIREEYKELLRELNNLASSFDFQGDNRQRRNKEKLMDNLKIQNELSKEDLVLQFPLQVGHDFENLQVIIPKGNSGINTENMTFILNLNTENLGNVKLNLQVVDKDISVQLIANEGSSSKIIENDSILKEGFNSIGYSLKDIFIEKKEKKVENLLKAVDTRI
ncbi:DUF6240 domain-containing protein [Anaerosalibacter sp. Marseille-P3206]|uniref:DUF6240 domain-containing protein n=1 Tax=Anaerosalibacter sp. Marseille-P3206 TaxID=1871005 RepID=UPI0009848765|nr:DUF6240 domain-containing protein [Anaerosalibacter sp. Marseille-P3206]